MAGQELLKNRPNFLDWAKVLGMFSVIIGHYVYYYEIPFSVQSVDWKIGHFVTLYHMPLFFIISGILYHKKDSIKEAIRKDFYNLLLPYILICLIDGVIYYGLWDGFPFKEIVRYLAGIAFGGDFYYKVHLFPAGPLWFLYSMFMVRCVVHIIGCSRASVCISLLIALCVMSINRDMLPLRLDSSIVGLMFFYFGMHFKNVWLRLDNIGTVKTSFIFVISFAILLFIDRYCLDPSTKQGMSININYFGKYPFVFILSGIIGTYSVLAISKILCKIKCNAVYIYSVGMIVPLGFHKQIMLTMHHLFGGGNLLIISICCMSLTYLLTEIIIKYFPILIGFRNIR